MSDKALQASLAGKIPKGALSLYQYFQGTINANGFTYLTLDDLEVECALSRPTLVSYIRKMEKAKLIVVERTTATSGYKMLG